jgi:NADH-quinone oxidoreductase subunit H
VFIALSAFAVVPLGAKDTFGDSIWGQAFAPFIADLNVGALYILAISSLAVYGIVLGGWSSGNHYSLLGALRSAAQMVSYEVSIALTLAGVFMFSQTLSMVGIVHSQVSNGIWFILVQPLGFLLYGIAATAEVNRAPFDLPEAEQELVAGYLTEFSGLRWSLYQMAEYINMIIVSSIAATLFFGGWTLGSTSGALGLPIIWYVVKVMVFLFIFMWMRATLPRIRYDQLMKLGWQVLLPLSVLNLLATGTVIAFGLPWWISGVFGVVVLFISGAVYYARLRRTLPASAPIQAQTTPKPGIPLPDSVRLVKVGAPVVNGQAGGSTTTGSTGDDGTELTSSR